MASTSYFRSNLRFLLRERGAQAALAEAARLTKAYVSRMLKDDDDPMQQTPSLDVACQIANALSVPIGDMADMMPKQFRTRYSGKSLVG